ncbi:DNA-binding protein YbiB [Massilia sp. W12]|uniref:DNA-binding protein YbiB n=1 Tax=Massilia sp. W12 TaxID=3126507 RepID=UPI0030CC95BC
MQQDFAAARFIKEIGRGRDGARAMGLEDAQELYGAMLDGRVADLQLGAILLAMRIKGESVEELHGFLRAAHARIPPLSAPAGEFAPVLLPSYNGARHAPNLLPLLACMLAQRGVPVLIHGVLQDAGRVATAEVMRAAGLPLAQQPIHIYASWQRHQPAFMAIDHLSPELAKLLSLRRVLGVRNSTHSVVKLLQPFAEPALRITSYTHPEYLRVLSAYYQSAEAASLGDALLMRATEGEAVANVRRAQQIDAFCAGAQSTLVQREEVAGPPPDLPERGAAETAAWMDEVLCEQRQVPPALLEQVEQICQAARALRARLPLSGGPGAGYQRG